MSTALTVLRQRPVRRYLGSTALAATGINLLITALFKQVYDLTGNPFDIGLIGLAQFVPGLLLALPSGYIADRFDRRRVAGTFLGGRLACAAGLVAFSLGDGDRVWLLFLIAVGIGTADAMIGPSRRAVLPLKILPRAKVPRGIVVASIGIIRGELRRPTGAPLPRSLHPSSLASRRRPCIVLPPAGVR